MKMFIVLLLLPLAFVWNTQAETISPIIVRNWAAGYKMKFKLQLLDSVKGGWKINLKFSKPVKELKIWRAEVMKTSADAYELENKAWNGNMKKCKFLKMAFIVKKVTRGESPATAVVTFTRKSGGSSPDPNACKPKTPPPLPTSGGTSAPVGSGEVVAARFISEWREAFSMHLKLRIQSEVNNGWKLNIQFSVPVRKIEIWSASFVSMSADGFVVEVENMGWNAKLGKCSYLEMPFNGHKLNDQVQTNPTAIVTFIRKQPSSGEPATIGGNSCISSTAAPTTNAPTTSKPNPTTAEATTPQPQTTETPAPTTEGATTIVSTSQPSTNAPTTRIPGPTTGEETTVASTSHPSTNAPTTENPTTVQPVTTSKPISGVYDYDEALHKSILFYEAQRSGDLPPNNRILWRKDSALGDKGNNNEDLTGGWYDAGDYVKFGFPMASSVTVLAWGLIQYRDAYQEAGELNNMLDCIKWPLDYFIKTHTSKFELYGQVGDGDLDHAYWGRPEDMTMARPAWKITPSKPGSDLAAETAAAMAAASIAFKQTDPSYAATLLQHAEELYEFADTYRGKYSDAIPNAAKFYNSFSGFKDELVWGAAWLYRATKKDEYLTKAKQYYRDFGMDSLAWALSWDDKKAGVQLLLAEITGESSYEQHAKAFLDSWLPGGGITYTPKGLAWRIKWGSNRYSANSAFLALVAADLGLKPTTYREFAKNQIHYMLGDTGRSFVVGFGTNPPQRPHHASSSCPLAPASCTWDQFHSPSPNPQVLNGALVGGPDSNDNYADKRDDYIKNEVTTDYNAGFQSAVAGLRELL